MTYYVITLRLLVFQKNKNKLLRSSVGTCFGKDQKACTYYTTFKITALAPSVFLGSVEGHFNGF